MSTKNKRILVFADWYEPGFKAGGPIRSCVNFADNMKDSRDIFIFTTDRDIDETYPYPDIECDKWIASEGINILYASPGYLTWKNIRKNINNINPDYVYINSMYSRYTALYPLLIKWLGLTRSAFVLAPRGMLKRTALQFKAAKKKAFLLLFKFSGIHKKITFHATDATEVNDIRNIFGSKVKYSQISNFLPHQQSIARSIIKESGELKIIFVGRIHPIKNLNLLLQYIQSLRTGILLTIVGVVEDDKYWKKCQDIIASLPPGIRVIFKKDIPNSKISDLMMDHHIFALPTEGENFGHAIFEALSVGRPVLVSDQTPWRNLQLLRAGWDLPLNDSSAFVEALRRALEMDNENFQSWCNGALELANNYIKRSDLKGQYLTLFS